mgnify:CR=1 FL=1
MKKYSKIQKILHEISPKTEAAEFYALCLLAMAYFENDDFEMIEFLDKEYYGRMIADGYGFSNSENEFSPSIVEFGEFVGFLNEDVQKIRNGEKTKAEVRASMWEYFQENISKTK